MPDASLCSAWLHDMAKIGHSLRWEKIKVRVLPHAGEGISTTRKDLTMSKEFQDMMASLKGTGYYQWMQREGVPVVEGFSVEDVRELELEPWRRLGGNGVC